VRHQHKRHQHHREGECPACEVGVVLGRWLRRRFSSARHRHPSVAPPKDTRGKGWRIRDRTASCIRRAGQKLIATLIQLVAGERVGQESRQILPGIIQLGSWSQSLVDAMAARKTDGRGSAFCALGVLV
jgi:hypothetical protein